MLLRIALFLFIAAGISVARRGEPSNLSSGYYAVDNVDDAPSPWRPTFFFVDTTYDHSSWIRIASGPLQQHTHPGNYFFWRPDETGNYSTMDTTNDCLAGPIPIGFHFNFYGKNYDSVTISSNGYIGFLSRAQGYSMMNTPAGKIPMYAERNDSADLKQYPSYAPRAIIAGLFADLALYNSMDSSKVYVRTSPSLDTFYVNFYNLSMRPSAPNYVENDRGRTLIFCREMQIVLVANDSSIQINYGPFDGVVQTFPFVYSEKIFERNSTIGLMNEDLTQYTSFNAGTHRANGRWDATENTRCSACNINLPAAGGYAVAFKRWKNTVRTLSVVYPTRDLEVADGQTIAPSATYTNLDSKPHSLGVRTVIRNNVTGLVVYSKQITLPSVKSGATVTGAFPIYSNNESILDHLGMMDAVTSIETIDGRRIKYDPSQTTDEWPFDDSADTHFYTIRERSLPLHEHFDSYSSLEGRTSPDPTLWRSIGADIVEGDSLTFDPPAPRRTQGNGIGINSWLDPVLHLDRKDEHGLLYRGNGVGDTITSMPYDLSGLHNAILSFDYQRAGKMDFPLYWDKDTLYGPEPAVIYSNGLISREGDSLLIEAKDPSAEAVNTPGSAWRVIGGIGGGYDLEFKHYSIDLSDWHSPKGESYLTKDFRFRLRLKAYDDGVIPPEDDGDDYYVDNISLETTARADLELMWARIISPYTHIPLSQTTALPVVVHIANNGGTLATAKTLTVKIVAPNDRLVYQEQHSIKQMYAGTDITITMPPWNAMYSKQSGYYRVYAMLENDTTYSVFYLDIGSAATPQEFAYDAGVNDLPSDPIAEVSASSDLTLIFNERGSGIGFYDLPSSFAMKFELTRTDTLYGVRAYFAAGNQQNDPIKFVVYRDSSGSCVPSRSVVANGTLASTRQGGMLDQYWPYYFTTPVILQPGTYWAAIEQLSFVNFFLGASNDRGGGTIAVSDPQFPVIPAIYSDPFGTNIGPEHNTGDISCAFALENVANSGNWFQWMPDIGFWQAMYPAAFSNYLAWGTYICDPCGDTFFTPYYWHAAGTFFPMIRPFFGQTEKELPVELLYFHGAEHNSKAVLTWATTSETNNSGFFIERRNAQDSDGFFNKIGFVRGAGNTSSQTGYTYIDDNVSPGRYTYRLVQTDLDGATKTSHTTDVVIGSINTFELGQNRPNPFTASTTITVTLSESEHARLIITNLLGEVVRTLTDGQIPAGTTSFVFDGKDDRGTSLPPGIYQYSLLSATKVTVNKMILLK